MSIREKLFAHQNTTTFELIHASDCSMTPWQFHDNISNNSTVTVLTIIQTNKQIPLNTMLLQHGWKTWHQHQIWWHILFKKINKPKDCWELYSKVGIIYLNRRQLQLRLQCESKKSPPAVFWHFFPNGWEFLINFLHTYYMTIYTLNYKFLSNYFQLWRSYAILSATTRRIFTFHYNFNFYVC